MVIGSKNGHRKGVSMKYAVWGTGIRGNLAVSFIGIENISVFIDEDIKMRRKNIYGRNIISYSDYLKDFNDCYIIVTPNDCSEIIRKLDASGVKHYSLLKDVIY